MCYPNEQEEFFKCFRNLIADVVKDPSLLHSVVYTQFIEKCFSRESNVSLGLIHSSCIIDPQYV